MKSTQTGIKGFDELVSGGMPAGGIVLLSGTPGTGKTIFGLEFLYNGAARFNEKGLYVSFEEKRGSLFKQAESFGWSLQALEKKGLLNVMSIPVDALEKSTPDSLVRVINERGIQRLVVDSLSTLTMNTPMLTSHPHTVEALMVKRFVYTFVQKLSSTGVTALLISHSHSDAMYSIDGVSEFICDGIIKLYSQTLGGEFTRALKVAKMRRVRIDEDIHPLEISREGVTVHAIR